MRCYNTLQRVVLFKNFGVYSSTGRARCCQTVVTVTGYSCILLGCGTTTCGTRPLQYHLTHDSSTNITRYSRYHTYNTRRNSYYNMMPFAVTPSQRPWSSRNNKRTNQSTNQQVLKCQMRDFIARNPEYVSFLAQRQGLDVSSVSHITDAAEDQSEEHSSRPSDVVFWERAVGGRLSEMFRFEE